MEIRKRQEGLCAGVAVFVRRKLERPKRSSEETEDQTDVPFRGPYKANVSQISCCAARPTDFTDVYMAFIYPDIGPRQPTRYQRNLLLSTLPRKSGHKEGTGLPEIFGR